MLSCAILLCLLQFPFIIFAEEEVPFRNIPGKDCGNLDNAESLVLISSKYPEVHCSGTILSHFLILTAAHCSSRKQLYVYWTLYDNNFSRMKESSRKVKKFTVLAQYVHPKFNRKTFEHDIAVFELDKLFDLAVQFPPNKEPFFTLLPEEEITDDLDQFSNCTKDSYTMGWAEVPTGRCKEDVIMGCPRAPVISSDACQKRYPKHTVKEHMCAESKDNIRGSYCVNNVGGAIICQKVQLGVISFGGCQRHAAKLGLKWGNRKMLARRAYDFGIVYPIIWRLCGECMKPSKCKKSSDCLGPFEKCQKQYFIYLCPAFYAKYRSDIESPPPITTNTSGQASTIEATGSKPDLRSSITFGDYPFVGIRTDKHLKFLWTIIDQRSGTDSVHQTSVYFLILPIILAIFASR